MWHCEYWRGELQKSFVRITYYESPPSELVLSNGAAVFLPEPRLAIVENCEEEGGSYADKSILAWRVDDLPVG
jgi:hypothetical protein